MDNIIAAIAIITFAALLGLVVYLVLRLQKVENQQSTRQSQSDSQRRSPTTRGRGTPSSETAPTSSPSPSRSAALDPEEANWLIAQTGELEGMRFHIGDRVASIGREYHSFIQVPDETASERHVLLMGDLHGLKLTDLGSSNGTVLNSQRIEPNLEYDLNDGDEIKIGDTIFLYRRQGRYTDDTDDQRKEITTQQKTKAMTAIQKPGKSVSLKQQVLQAVQQTDGDFEKAAAQVDLDIDIVKRIVHRAVNKS